jgi:predicted PurR-regulated permease PerM
MRKLASATAIVVGVLSVALALWQMREAVTLLLIALAVSAGLSPAVSRLNARGLRRVWAIGMPMLLILGLLGLAIATIASQVLVELEQAAIGLPLWYDRLRQSMEGRGGWVADLARDLPSSTGLIVRLADAEALPGLLLGLATRLTVAVVLVLSAVFLGFYWLLEQPQMERAALALLPLQARSRVRGVWIRIYREVGVYVRGGAALSLLTFFLLLIVYVLLRLPGAALMALFGGLAMVVPVLGAPLALLPTLGVLAIRGPGEGLLALGAAAAVIALAKLVVAPRLFHHGLTVSPVLTIVCIMILGDLGGILLILFGPPLAAAIQTAVQALRIDPVLTPALPQGDEAIAKLHQRLDAIMAQAPPDEPQVGSLVARARAIVSAASDLLAQNMLR